MQVKIILYGMLRERLAKESRGRLNLDLPDSSTIADVLATLQVDPHLLCVVNGENERDFTRSLKNGDELKFFHPVGGGLYPAEGDDHGI